MRLRSSRGLSIAYWTRGAGRPVLCLHPVGTRGAFWTPLERALGDRCRLIAPDSSGHGDSEIAAAPFSLSDLVEDAVDLLRLHSAGDAVVIGCSMGGMVAQGVALRAPELISALVLSGTGYSQTPQSREALQKRAEAALQGMPTVVGTTLERWFPVGFAARNPAVVDSARDWLLNTDPVAFSWGWQAIRSLDNAARLPSLDVPTLLVHGAEDASVPEARMREMAELLPRASFVSMPDVGHLAPFEQPELFCRLLEGFLASVPADPAKLGARAATSA